MISRLFLTLLLAASPAAPQEPAMVRFSAQTKLVLLSFHVRQGKQFVPDLKAGDVTLFEDGKPRPFTIFDGPATQGRMPLELVLLFDVNPAIPYFWDPADAHSLRITRRATFSVTNTAAGRWKRQSAF